MIILVLLGVLKFQIMLYLASRSSASYIRETRVAYCDISSAMTTAMVAEKLSSHVSTNLQILGYLAVSALATYLGFAILSWYRLRPYKGPWLASFSELWLGKAGLSGHFGDVLDNVNRKYGTLFT